MRSFMIVALLFTICTLASAFTTIHPKSRSCRSLIGSKRSTSCTSLFAAADSAPKKKKKATKKKTAAAVEEEGDDDEVVTFRKPEFVSRIAEKTGMSKSDSEAALSAVLETITEEVAAGKRISMLGFGTFKLTKRKARKGRNPKTGEPIDIAASNTPSFSAGKAFKERCNL